GAVRAAQGSGPERQPHARRAGEAREHRSAGALGMAARVRTAARPRRPRGLRRRVPEVGRCRCPLPGRGLEDRVGTRRPEVTQARRWRRLDLPAREDFAEDGRSFQGRVQVDEAVPWSAEYRIAFDEQWVTLEATVSVQRAGRSRRLRLEREASGRWL